MSLGSQLMAASSNAVETVRAEKLVAGGDALAHLADGRVVFVRGALPGESVVVEVHTSKRDFARGEATAVLEPSASRVVAPCPRLSAGCGGCSWQHAEPTAQLQWKGEIVTEALQRIAKLPNPDVRAGGAVAPWHYRTTLRLAVASDGTVGLRAWASHNTVAIDDCLVAHPALVELLSELRVRGAEEISLRTSVATGEVTVFADSSGARLKGLPESVRVGANASLHEDIAGTRLQVSAASFFQSGAQAAELLVTHVRVACGELLTSDGGPLLDAYGGVGLFSATLAVPLGMKAIVVESSDSACHDAAVNLGEAADVVHSRLEDWIPRPVKLVIADPARAGLGREGVAVLAATNAERIVLVSCDAASLARDAVLLATAGYQHRGSTVLDLFPHTPHVEVVTRFDRSSSP
ncbi:TRAM domain-containing protein [soil metagenome]